MLVRLREEINELKPEIQEGNHAYENVRESMKVYRHQVLKIISNDRLDNLLTLSENQIEEMNFAELRGTNQKS